MGLSLLLLAAGHDTTANMITLGTYALLRDPDQAARLGEPGMMSTGVDELIRYLSIVHNGVLRKAVRDVTVGDQLVRAGEHVAVVLESANRDRGSCRTPIASISIGARLMSGSGMGRTSASASISPGSS
ncbi:Cytochrome P450-SU2 [Clavibacter michiganensis subsp. michiganensis]|uniref:Cytochrome P450-SU2 n=1 Tax=Clavibacter michiganensis subsp. michiganensis TaxID=33013 RepID=A0A251XM80_CLAMM|nr:Cytochrome P450-SU2 [Clavibacter michiganensis subsp. michiganensis]OUE04592.1 Cytochrome P450-SU2 [Clavibacter michiganensis subsp. michiganensis]